MIQDGVKILVAFLLAFLIGLEREKSDKPAGLRSCLIVTMSITYFMLLNFKLNTNYGNLDIARIPAYCMAGIGFLGSGVIVINKKKLEGVTTACVMLALVAIGLLSGAGELVLAISLGLLIFIILNLKFIITKLKKIC